VGDRVSHLMLRVSTIRASSAGSSAKYYTRYLTGAPGEVPGVWSGGQAAGLGLSGKVTRDDLQALLEGRDPRMGTPLGYPLVDRILADRRVVQAVAGLMRRFQLRSPSRCAGRCRATTGS
jgi:TrwC relaxase